MGYLSDWLAAEKHGRAVAENHKVSPCPTCGVLLVDKPGCSTVLHRLAHRSARLRDNDCSKEER